MEGLNFEEISLVGTTSDIYIYIYIYSLNDGKKVVHFNLISDTAFRHISKNLAFLTHIAKETSDKCELLKAERFDKNKDLGK